MVYKFTLTHNNYWLVAFDTVSVDSINARLGKCFSFFITNDWPGLQVETFKGSFKNVNNVGSLRFSVAHNTLF